MGKREKESRKFCQKALTPIRAIMEKYPDGIKDIQSISEEARALIQIKVQQFRECIKHVHFPNKPVWWESMRITRNKIAHQESVAQFNSDMAAASVNNVLPLRLACYASRRMDDIEHYTLYFGEKPSLELKKDLAKKVVTLYNSANDEYNLSRTTKDKNYYLKQRDSLDRIMWNDMYIKTKKSKSNRVVQYNFYGEDYSVE